MLDASSLYRGGGNKSRIARQKTFTEPWEMQMVDGSNKTVVATAAAAGTAGGLHAMASAPIGPTLSLAFFVQNMVVLPA